MVNLNLMSLPRAHLWSLLQQIYSWMNLILFQFQSRKIVSKSGEVSQMTRLCISGMVQLSMFCQFLIYFYKNIKSPMKKNKTIFYRFQMFYLLELVKTLTPLFIQKRSSSLVSTLELTYTNQLEKRDIEVVNKQSIDGVFK